MRAHGVLGLVAPGKRCAIRGPGAFLAVMVLGLLLLGVTASGAAGSMRAAPARISEDPQTEAVVAEASAEVIPRRFAGIGFTTSGQVAQLLVEEGASVEAGQLLIALDTAALEAETAQAEAALAVAEAQLDLLRARPRAEDVAVAEAQLAVAEASLARAVAERSRITAATQHATVTAAEADVANAEAQESAARIYEIQQREFGIEDWREDVNLLRLRSAELALEAAEARRAEVPQIQRTTLAQLNAMIQEREAQQDRAASSLAQARHGATAEALAIAEARVAQAAVALRNTRAREASMRLTAPFDGMVVGLEACLGEVVAPGQTVLTVAELDNLEVETTDLSERDVAGIDVGMHAVVTVEALDLELTGHVTRVALQPTVAGGDVTYPVRVVLEETPPDLRWGMTAQVTFER
ncbi:MAG: efflux RND transporter periplasmic adaptor subunit [Anaerolineae bacterium]|nr:efflux RND transporter periplasmic adaptor subunit [Anaerolineae bacterium]